MELSKVFVSFPPWRPLFLFQEFWSAKSKVFLGPIIQPYTTNIWFALVFCMCKIPWMVHPASSSTPTSCPRMALSLSPEPDFLMMEIPCATASARVALTGSPSILGMLRLVNSIGSKGSRCNKMHLQAETSQRC